MLRYFLIILIFVCCTLEVFTQEYKWDWPGDGIALAWSATLWQSARHVKKGTKLPTLEELSRLDSDQIWGIDKISLKNSSYSADHTSDYFLWGSALLPFTSFLSSKGRDNAGSITGMAFQTAFITDGIINLFKGTAERYRPYTYNKSLHEKYGLGQGSRHSFASGHTSTTAAMSFFTAKVYTDLHPNSDWNPVAWTMAAAIPAVTGWLRIKAGKHFPTDVIVGYVVGALVGFVVPHLHLN